MRNLYLSFGVFVIATVISLKATAQKLTSNDSTHIKKISRELAINEETSKKVWAAMQFNKKEIDSIENKSRKELSDTTKRNRINAGGHKNIKKMPGDSTLRILMKQRQERVNALLTIDQQKKLGDAIKARKEAKANKQLPDKTN